MANALLAALLALIAFGALVWDNKSSDKR